MQKETWFPNFLIRVNAEEGVYTEPRLEAVESKLRFVQARLKDDEEWSIIISPDGQIVEVNGFVGMDLQLGQIVGTAILEFVKAIDPDGDGGLVKKIEAIADEIGMFDLDNIRHRLQSMIGLDVEIIGAFVPEHLQVEFMYPYYGRSALLGASSTVLMLPGVAGSIYKKDCEAFLRERFFRRLERARNQTLIRNFMATAAQLLELKGRMGKSGIRIPGGVEPLLEAVAKVVPEDLASERGSFTGLDALTCTVFPGYFPELEERIALETEVIPEELPATDGSLSDEGCESTETPASPDGEHG